MSKPNFAQIFKNVQTAVSKHSPEILTGIGIAGMITTTILAVKATPKAVKLIEREKINRSKEDAAPMKKIDVVKTAWKCYIPATVTGTMSIACLIGASSANARRNAALATAYTLSETALKEYQEKVVETIGEKKEEVVRNAIAKDKVDNNPVSKNEVIITGKGDTLCFDIISGRYFHSDIDKLKKAANDLNRQMRDDMYISLNEFYDEIGIDTIAMGYDIGWNIDKGYIDLDFSSQLTDEGKPCLVINYSVAPRWDYKKIW